MDNIIYIFYFVFVIILNYYEYKKLRTFLNPFSILSIPFSIIVFICITFNNILNFVPFRVEVLYPWLFGLCIFWLSGRMWVIVCDWTKSYQEKYQEKVNYLILFSIIATCLFFLVKFRSLSANSIDLGSKDFGENFMVGGIAGRLSNLMLIFFPVVFFIKINRILKIGLLFLFFLFIVSYGSKTLMMGTIIVSFIVGVLRNNVKLNFKILLGVGLLCMLLFIVYYGILLDDSDVLFRFVFRHFYFYITSGVLGFNQFIATNTKAIEDPTYLMLPIVNFIRTYIEGSEPLPPHSIYWFATDLEHGTETNVFTFFGTIDMYLDTLSFVLYTFVIGFMSYGMMYLIYQKKSLFLQIMYAYNLLILFYGWFNCGYNLLRYWEIFIYCILFYYISKIHLRWEKKY